MRKSAILISCFFAVVICVPMLLSIFRMKTGILSISAAGMVPVTSHLRNFVKNFDNQFWGRETLVQGYIEIKRKVLHVSPLPEKVIEGKDGWLFLTDYAAMDNCRNLYPFSNLQLDSIGNYLNALADSLEKDSIYFFVSVVPDKHTIYPEYLPQYVRKVNPQSRLQQLRAYFEKSNPRFEFIDLTDTLMRAKSAARVYYREESHWNDEGAFAGYQNIVQRMKARIPQLNILTSDSCTFTRGEEDDIDLAKLLGESIDYTEECIRVTPKSIANVIDDDHHYAIPEAKKLNPNYAYRKRQPGAEGPSIVIFRDSYFEALTPFFACSFPESTFIWTTEPNLSYVRKEGVDIVLLEVAERHLYLLTR